MRSRAPAIQSRAVAGRTFAGLPDAALAFAGFVRAGLVRFEGARFADFFFVFFVGEATDASVAAARATGGAVTRSRLSRRGARS